jgi:hypothetical protein
MLACPVLLGAFFFPTPAEDLREQINWGSAFVVYTSKHPPLQSWLTGLVALTSLIDAWPYILVAQLLNVAGLAYAVRIAREFIDPQLARPIAVAFCGSAPVSAGIVVVALNADQIQGPLWLGVLFHALRAAQLDRWVDWLACAIFAALSLLAKYFSVLFLAALVVALVTSQPTLLRRPKAYVAALICLGLSAVHFVPMLSHPAAIDYGMRVFNGTAKTSSWITAAFPRRAFSLMRFLASFILLQFPLLLVLLRLWRRGEVQQEPLQQHGPRWRIVLTTAILIAGLTALIVVGGARYDMRFSEPLLPLCVLSLSCIVRIHCQSVTMFIREFFAIWLAGAFVALVYAITFISATLREPADEAEALIRADWERHYDCGPAYVVGERFSAHAIGLYYGGSVIGLSLRDYWHEDWVDRDRIAKLGFILVASPERRSITTMADVAPLERPASTLELPYRRTLRSANHVYQYYFVSPKAC